MARRLCYLARPMKNAWRRFVAIEIGKNNSFVVFLISSLLLLFDDIMNNQKLAIFEFDGTVIEGSSMFQFYRYLSGSPLSYLWGLFATSGFGFCKAFHICSKRTYFEHLAKHFLRGMSEDDIEAASRQFVFILNKSIRGKVIAGMQQRRLEGYRIVLVSGGIADVIRPWAAQFGINDVFGRELEYDSDRHFTGKFESHDCDYADMEASLGEKLNTKQSEEVLAVSCNRKNMHLEKIATRYCLL